MRLKWSDLLNTFEFVSVGHHGEHQAVLRKETGEFFCHSELIDDVDEWPDDVDDEEKYLVIPDKSELGLGKPLVLDFSRECLPADFDEVRRMFSRKGAYGRFKDLLQRRGALERWYEFEARATENALRSWCEDNDIEVDG
jgi:hypothetical protein